MIKPRLLSVKRASADVTAGIPGHCAVSVRVLDDITLRIHAGELLVVQVPEAFGQSMLLAALAGRDHGPQQRYVRAVREAAPGLRIRRAALHVHAVQEIMRGWQELAGAPTVPASRTLYLLRASRGGPLTLREAAEWRRWGRQSHARHDGIVIACPPMHGTRESACDAPAATCMHEPTARYALQSANDALKHARTIRILELRAGRLHDVRAPRRSSSNAGQPNAVPTPHPWSASGSGDAQRPTACHPRPRASPES